MAVKRALALNEFLRETKANFKKSASWHVIIGNEACDLDSMVSSIAYAYLLSRIATPEAPTIFPVLNIPREDFKLRTEAVYLFSEVGVEVSNLIFLDEITLDTLKTDKSIKVGLVDHNKLAKSQTYLEGVLDEIIDHHKDDHLYPHVMHRIIEPVGSTATLITERIMRQNKVLIDEGVATLLLGTILLDTVNLNPSRTHPKDKTVIELLSQYVSISRDELFNRLQFEKFNSGALSSYDLLRKDYKEWQAGTVKYGISSVPISVGDWQKKDRDFAQELLGYVEQKGLDVLLSMNFFSDPEFSRELGVISRDRRLLDKIVAQLKEEDLQLQPIKIGEKTPDEDDRILFFQQQNVKISRKKIQPVLEKVFQH